MIGTAQGVDSITGNQTASDRCRSLAREIGTTAWFKLPRFKVTFFW
jgi:hypothetical protein